MGLHNKKYYQKRRQYIKQPFEVQENEVRRIDYVFYVVIALPTLYALVHDFFVSNFGRAVFFALFFIWWTFFLFQIGNSPVRQEKRMGTRRKIDL